jgi:predicted methyltransferase MtxX (methanogen marker protein 4)
VGVDFRESKDVAVCGSCTLRLVLLGLSLAIVLELECRSGATVSSLDYQIHLAPLEIDQGFFERDVGV